MEQDEKKITLTVPSGRGMLPVFYTSEGKGWVQFIELGNFPVTIELPGDASFGDGTTLDTA